MQQEPEILETVDRVDEAVDKAVVEPSVKRKTAEVKPEDAVAKFAFHPTGPKFVNTWLWSHFKLSRRHEKWALCAICEKAQRIMWVPRVDSSTSTSGLAKCQKCHSSQSIWFIFHFKITTNTNCF